MNYFAKIPLFRDNSFSQSREAFRERGAQRWCIHSLVISYIIIL